MNPNTSYQTVLNYFRSTLPKQHTDRQADLRNLLGLQNSFCLFSQHRNGTTTLLQDFITRVDGIYIDAHGLPEESVVQALEQRIDTANTPIVFDEAIVLWRRLKNSPSAIEYIQHLSTKRQVGLRFHSKSAPQKDELLQHEFKIIQIGKIPYQEFKYAVEAQFKTIQFPFPERFIQYAYQTYDHLAELNWYIGEAFHQMIKKSPDAFELSEADIKKSVEEKYLWFKIKK